MREADRDREREREREREKGVTETEREGFYSILLKKFISKLYRICIVEVLKNERSNTSTCTNSEQSKSQVRTYCKLFGTRRHHRPSHQLLVYIPAAYSFLCSYIQNASTDRLVIILMFKLI